MYVQTIPLGAPLSSPTCRLIALLLLRWRKALWIEFLPNGGHKWSHSLIPHVLLHWDSSSDPNFLKNTVREHMLYKACIHVGLWYQKRLHSGLDHWMHYLLAGWYGMSGQSLGEGLRELWTEKQHREEKKGFLEAKCMQPDRQLEAYTGSTVASATMPPVWWAEQLKEAHSQWLIRIWLKTKKLKLLENGKTYVVGFRQTKMRPEMTLKKVLGKLLNWR